MDLVIEHLWKTYPNGVVALNDVSLTIPPGLFGLLGPNGAGKSTLMRILATLQEADAGQARLGTLDVLRERDAVRRTLGYLPQEFGLYPKATAEQMLDHFALLKGIVNARERRDTVAALLRQTNLHGARKQKLGGFSGGMRQRFGIAVALIGNPRLIIVDEPTAGLDPAERARFLNLLSELGENAVVILSTHIVEDVSDLCTRMAIIEHGRILLEGEPARAVEALRGRVWRRQVERADLPRWETVLPVISTTLVAGRTVIHVYGDAAPHPTFEPVEPDLKDVYFTVIRGIRIGQGTGERQGTGDREQGTAGGLAAQSAADAWVGVVPSAPAPPPYAGLSGERPIAAATGGGSSGDGVPSIPPPPVPPGDAGSSGDTRRAIPPAASPPTAAGVSGDADRATPPAPASQADLFSGDGGAAAPPPAAGPDAAADRPVADAPGDAPADSPGAAHVPRFDVPATGDSSGPGDGDPRP